MSALKPSEVLAKAADLIEPEGAWTTGHYARGKSGRVVLPESRYAVCWCAAGAIRKSSPRGAARREAVAWLEEIVQAPATGWNDAPKRTRAEVVAAFRKASELAKAAGQ